MMPLHPGSGPNSACKVRPGTKLPHFFALFMPRHTNYWLAGTHVAIFGACICPLNKTRATKNGDRNNEKPESIKERAWHMSSWKLPLVLSYAYNTMNMSVAVRTFLFLFISVARLGNACTTQHAYRNTVLRTGAPPMNEQHDICTYHPLRYRCWEERA